MQDLKRQSNRRPVVRKIRSSPTTVRKNRSNPIPGLSIKLRKANSEPGFSNFWFPSYFIKNEPAFLRKKIKSSFNKLIGTIGLVFFLWIFGGSLWIGKGFFDSPLKKVFLDGEKLLNEAEILKISRLRPGQLLPDLDPYMIAKNLQNHPVIQRADIRLRFPNEIHLFIYEHIPIAIIEVLGTHSLKETYSTMKNNYFLIADHQHLIKRIPVEQILNSVYSELPFISGLKKNSLQMGTSLNSPILERGLGFLKIFDKISIRSKEIESQNFLENQKKIVNMSYKNIHIDVSDPLNLKISWPNNTSRFKKDSFTKQQDLALTVQMGSRKFSERLRTFQSIYPILYKQHPKLKSVDLRYKNRVMLVP